MPDLLEGRLEEVESRVAAAARRSGRDPQAITLVMVTKRQSVEQMLAVQEYCRRRAAQVVFGESYVQEFKKKKELLAPGYEVHLIGSLQSNKVRDAVRLFDVIESVHCAEIARLISKEAARAGKIQKILLQVNVSNDPAKHGFPPQELGAFVCGQLPKLTHIDCLGLMTITRLYERPEDVRSDFRTLKRLAMELQTLEPLATMLRGKPFGLSMGMSQDFEIAIEEGATWVRVGTALFGERR